MKTGRSETGAVLLTTLLIMALMASLSVMVMDDIRLAVKRTANIQSYAQVDWYANGAEDFAHHYLKTQISALSPQEMNAVLAQAEPITFPIEIGAITLHIRDGSQCFSLRALKDAPGRRQFRQLLDVLGFDTLKAASLTSAMVDWIDADSQTLPDGAEDYIYLGRTPAYRTANTDFTSVMELRSIAGMDETRFQTLRPFLCARPDSLKNSPSGTASGEDSNADGLNINGLTPAYTPLLAAVLGGIEHVEIARRLIVDRPAAGYTDLEQVLASPHLRDVSLKNANLDTLIFSPSQIWVEADIRTFEARRSFVTEYGIQSGRVLRGYRRLGDEARRPHLVEPAS